MLFRAPYKFCGTKVIQGSENGCLRISKPVKTWNKQSIYLGLELFIQTLIMEAEAETNVHGRFTFNVHVFVVYQLVNGYAKTVGTNKKNIIISLSS